MSTATAARTFSSHMVDANTFALTINSRTIEIRRSAVVLTDREDIRSIEAGVGGVTSTWTAAIVCPNGERREIARRGGSFVSPRCMHSVEALDRFGLNSIIEEATWFAAALNRLTIMVERELLAPSSMSKKARKQLEAGAVRLRDADIVGDGNAFGVVAGETIFVVSRGGGKSKEVNERSYTIGDQAVHSGYNLAYIGEVVSISPKTIKIVARGERGHVLTHSQFVFWNRSPIEDSYKRNADWSD